MTAGAQSPETPVGQAQFDVTPGLDDHQMSSTSPSDLESEPTKSFQQTFPAAFGSVIEGSGPTAYVGATHWAAILDDVSRQALPWRTPTYHPSDRRGKKLFWRGRRKKPFSRG